LPPASDFPSRTKRESGDGEPQLHPEPEFATRPDAAAQGSRLGRQADRGGAWLLEDDREGLAAAGRVAALRQALALQATRRPHRLAGRPLPAACGQCRRRAPGPGDREGHPRQPAHGRAGGGSLRQDLVAAARATVRFETQPGEQMQIDFGERRVTIGEEPTRVFLFVGTLGYLFRRIERASLRVSRVGLDRVGGRLL
jgi:hypothetical protein